MKGIAKLISVDGAIKPIHPKNGTDFTLEEVQELIGGYVEVAYPPSSMGTILIVDEEGLNKNLPHNELASTVMGQPIAGPALLCHDSQFR